MTRTDHWTELYTSPSPLELLPECVCFCVQLKAEHKKFRHSFPIPFLLTVHSKLKEIVQLGIFVVCFDLLLFQLSAERWWMSLSSTCAGAVQHWSRKQSSGDTWNYKKVSAAAAKTFFSVSDTRHCQLTILEGPTFLCLCIGADIQILLLHFASGLLSTLVLADFKSTNSWCRSRVILTRTISNFKERHLQIRHFSFSIPGKCFFLDSGLALWALIFGTRCKLLDALCKGEKKMISDCTHMRIDVQCRCTSNCECVHNCKRFNPKKILHAGGRLLHTEDLVRCFLKLSALTGSSILHQSVWSSPRTLYLCVASGCILRTDVSSRQVSVSVWLGVLPLMDYSWLPTKRIRRF